ncbi:short-chain dehydrogenase [Paecilomyces variotii No. 5]|uniref:Short-chain dehydrogenase n=1 Tax=Byssochlamys spectabilis (strain No. 5 / NBRC 109023) TaxID=1356009 RepID=V5FBP4_BYSSN|nr:short-chain dehydrogenase [Paecilomyces variotii No. 5]
MAGTIIITGANGSLATPAVEILLSKHPGYNLILTADKVSIRQLGLADLSAVHEFATVVAGETKSGKLPPLSELTGDGYEKTFQVNHIAHAALVLRLIGYFKPESAGRIVLFGSENHWPGKDALEKHPPAIPDNLEALVKPLVQLPADPTGRGLEHYANSKLAIIMWMYALNRYLENDPALRHVTAIAVNPGNLGDSRPLRVNTTMFIFFLSWFILRPFLFILRRVVDPTMRTSREAAADIVEFATNTASPGERGYFTLSKKDVSSPDSFDEEKQEKLWQKILELAL